MSKIFISYRRQDSRDITGRIYDRLLRHWEAERIFKDVDNIDPGEDYRDVIDREIAQCSLFLAVIGPSWLAAKKADGKRRLDDPTDMVRIEIETALARNQRVIPIVVGEGRMPEPEELPESLRELADRHAFPVRPDPDFHRDMDRLVKLIERAMTSGEAVLAELIDPPAPQPVPPPVLLSQFAAQPAVKTPFAPQAAYDSSPSHYSAASGKMPAAGGPMAPAVSAGGMSAATLLFAAAMVQTAACLAGLFLVLAALAGSFMPSETMGEDVEYDAVMRIMCVISALGSFVGLAGAGCMFLRKLYWGAVGLTCVMTLMTLLPCPFLNVPAAGFALIVLMRHDVRALFD
jgi:hypothetical protein